MGEMFFDYVYFFCQSTLIYEPPYEHPYHQPVVPKGAAD